MADGEVLVVLVVPSCIVEVGVAVVEVTSLEDAVDVFDWEGVALEVSVNEDSAVESSVDDDVVV